MTHSNRKTYFPHFIHRQLVTTKLPANLVSQSRLLDAIEYKVSKLCPTSFEREANIIVLSNPLGLTAASIRKLIDQAQIVVNIEDNRIVIDYWLSSLTWFGAASGWTVLMISPIIISAIVSQEIIAHLPYMAITLVLGLVIALTPIIQFHAFLHDCIKLAA